MGNWNMVYNVDFEVASVIFMLCLAAYIGMQYNLSSERNRQFYAVVWVIIIMSILDIASAITIGNAHKIPYWVNVLLSTLYFFSAGLLGVQFINYAVVFRKISEKRTKNIKLLSVVLLAVYTIILIHNAFAKTIFYFENGYYMHGPLYIIVYIVPYTLFLVAWTLIIIASFKNRMRFQEKIATLFYIACSISGMLLQLFVFTNVLLTAFTLSIASVIMLFFLESNDYVAMSKMLEERTSMNEATEKALHSKNRFIQSIRELVGEPVIGIIDEVEEIKEQDEEGKFAKEIGQIAASCVGLLSTVDQIVEYSEAEIGQMEISEEAYNVSSLIESCVVSIKKAMDEKELKLDIQYVDVPSELIGDREKISRIMNKILLNAVNYTEEGQITIRVMTNKLDKNHRMLTISVEDTGLGIKEENLEGVFNAFESGGLGLAFVKNMSERMGGSVGIYSKEAEGTLVYIEIPQGIIY